MASQKVSNYLLDAYRVEVETQPDGSQRQIIKVAEISAIPLPSGAATEATLSAFRTDFNAEDFATQTTLAALNAKVTTVNTSDTRQATHDNLNLNANIQVANVDVAVGNPVPISAASLPLPTGAATATLQSDGNSTLTGIQDNTSLLLTEATFTARVNVLGQNTMANCTPVVLASNQSAIPVTQSGTWNIGAISTSVTPGTAAVNLGKAEDAGHTTGDVGVMALGVRRDGNAVASSGTSVDYEPLQMSSFGALKITEYGHAAGLPNAYINIASLYEVPVSIIADPITLSTWSVTGGFGCIQGGLAHDVADNQFPVKIGGKSSSTQPTAVSATGDVVNAYFDLNGYLHNRNEPHRDTITQIFNAQIFNNVTTSATSSNFDSTRDRDLYLFISLTVANLPTSIRLIPQFSNDGGTTWFDLGERYFVDLRYVPGQMPLTEVLLIPNVPNLFRLKAVASGTTATATFTLSAWVGGMS